MDYLFHIFVLIGIYSILSLSLDLVVGRTGLLSVAHAAFYGLGAYSTALFAVKTGLPFLLGIVIGMSFSIAASYVISLASVRLQEDYFVLATLAFQMFFYSIANNFVDITEGPMGISGIPRPALFGIIVQTPAGFAILSMSIAAITLMIVSRITDSPIGRVLSAIREDEILTSALGKNSTKFKMSIFAISAVFAALAGSLFAHYTTYISPHNFTVIESILIISMVIIGGAGSVLGPIVGALFLVLLPEFLRFVGLPNDVAGNAKQIIYGVALVALMMWRTNGIIGNYSFKFKEINQ